MTQCHAAIQIQVIDSLRGGLQSTLSLIYLLMVICILHKFGMIINTMTNCSPIERNEKTYYA